MANDILCGEYKPRERLVESDLMEKYGATRNAVRNAFKALQAQKLIVHQPNRGVAVAEVTEKDAVDLYRVRVLLESYAAHQVMAKLAERQLNDLKILQKQFITAAENHDFLTMSQTNNSFHEMTFKASGNQVVSGLIEELRTRSNLLLYHIWRRPGQFGKSIKDHEDLLAALQKRDLAAFIKVNSRHVLASVSDYIGKPLDDLGLKNIADESYDLKDLLQMLA